MKEEIILGKEEILDSVQLLENSACITILNLPDEKFRLIITSENMKKIALLKTALENFNPQGEIAEVWIAVNEISERLFTYQLGRNQNEN